MSAEHTSVVGFLYDTVWDQPTMVFESAEEANEFIERLVGLAISYRVRLVMPPRRCKQPMQTIITLLDTADGVRH